MNAAAWSGRACAGGERRRLRACVLPLVAFVCAAAATPAGADRAESGSAPPPPQATFARDAPFDAGTVVELARALAKAPYVAPPSSLPEGLAKLDYDQYRDVRFRPSETIWGQHHSFRLQVLPLGYLFTTPVEIALVKDGRATHLAYRPDLFTAGRLVPAGALPSHDIGFSGLRLLYPINDRRHFDEVAVFQGASYFRSLGKDQLYGLSARGLALKIGDPAGEEFPNFRAFWIEEPAPKSASVTVHALLDSPSVTGAYRFEIWPGRSTIMNVDAVLFPRVELAQAGLAPATSMFLFAPSDRLGADDFRPRVHDSDGLLVLNGRGEHLWRPLANPARLQISVFGDRSPRGFGLMQRHRALADYQDFESHFELRPSLWVEPRGDWGDGDVILTEIPSDAEIHDNVVAYWRPRKPIAAGSEFRLAYRLWWGGEPARARDHQRVLSTMVGRADVRVPTPVRLFVVDYAPGEPPCGDCPPPTALVTASAGKVRDVVVADNPLTRGYRVSFVLDPEKAELCELRLELKFEDSRCAEVWLYRWTKR